MFRLILGLAAVTLFAQSVSVETELGKRVKGLLESTRLSDKAWGARLGAGLHLSGIEELLIAELHTSQKFVDAATDGPEYAYIQSLLDSLIELGVEIPVGAIIPYQSRWKTETLILLSRGTRNTEVIRQMQAVESDDITWLALSNLLLERWCKDLFEGMLGTFPITHRFSVFDQDEPVVLEIGPIDNSPRSPPRRNFPSDFPPVSLYRLGLGGSHSDVLVADGPRSVYYRRFLVPAGGSVEWPDWTYPHLTVTRTECQLEYLAKLGERPLDEVRRMFQSKTKIKWRTTSELNQEIEKKLDDQAFELRQFVIGIKLRGKSNATLVRLEIKPTLSDYRRKGNGVLSRPRPREIVLDLR